MSETTDTQVTQNCSCGGWDAEGLVPDGHQLVAGDVTRPVPEGGITGVHFAIGDSTLAIPADRPRMGNWREL